MKPSLSCVLLLLFITTSTCSTTASAAQDFIKDSTGKKVLNDVPYHIGPVKGGRIKLTNTIHNKTICPYDVVQESSNANPGGQFMFTLIGTRRETYLRKSHTLGINSGVPKSDPCQKPTFWTIPDAEGKAPDNFITTGGFFETAVTCFQVVEYPKPTNPKVPSYLLQHCPYFCGAGPMKCYNVSIYEDKGVRRLASTGSTRPLLSLSFIRFPIKPAYICS